MKFKIFSLLIITLLLLPIIVLAEEPEKSLYDTCWSEKECEGVKGNFKKNGTTLRWVAKEGGKAGEGKYENKPCGGNTGLCFPITREIELQQPLPSQTGPIDSVKDFAQYLTIFYKFFVAMIAVMSVVMIMWGGFKLIYRGGSAPAVTDAKETIFGAIAALVIALLSYSLLNLVNPKLVTFPDLEIPMIKPRSLISNDCPVHLKNTLSYCGRSDINPETGKNCTGIVCSLDQIKDLSRVPIAGVCAKQQETAGNLSCGNFIAQGSISWSGNAYVDFISLHAVCGDNKSYLVFTPGNEERMQEDVAEGSNYYKIGFPPPNTSYADFLNTASYSTCDSRSGLRGYYLLVQVNDDTGVFSTEDDNFAVGKAGKNCLPISGADPEDPNKLKWSEVPNSRLWQINDFPLVSGNLTYKYCQSAGSENGELCDKDSDCKVSSLLGVCSGSFTYNSCDLEINRQFYPAR